MKDLARMLGVSVATVSRALRDSPSISKQRREEIQRFARDHNFRPNIVAETLRNSRRAPIKVIGVIVPEFVHYYFATVLAGIEHEASSRGYRLLVASSGEDEAREAQLCDDFYRNRVCGVIVAQSKHTVHYDHFVHLVEHRMPLVFYDRICPAINANRVVVDDYKGAFKAVSYLIERGCRRIAYYGASLNLEIAVNRLNGYKDALYKHGLQPDEQLIKLCDNRSDAELITPMMLEMDNRPDAFFAVNDETAVGILYTAKRMGLRVPEELMICGFSSDNQATACDPQLTSVEQNGLEVGREAVDILIGLVEGTLPTDHAQKRIVRTRLVIRGTTR